MPKLNLFDRINFEIESLLEEKQDMETKIQKPSCFLSKEQIDEHFDEHYKGYLKGLKDAKTRFEKAAMDESNHNGSDYRAAMCDYAFNYNGVLLHETYFQCLGSKEMGSGVIREVSKTYGSKDKFLKHLKASLMAARGWVTLCFNHDWELRLSIVDFHGGEGGILGCPTLALDVWEHAYYVDFKSDKSAYVDRMIEDINWEFVEEHVEKLLTLK